MKFLFIICLFLCIHTRVYALNIGFNQRIYEITECNDGLDNDGDGGIDFSSDNQCTSWEDDNEVLTQEAPISFTQTIVLDDSNQEQKPKVQEKDSDSSFIFDVIGRVLGIGDQDLSKNNIFILSTVLLCCMLLNFLILLLFILYRRRKNEED